MMRLEKLTQCLEQWDHYIMLTVGEMTITAMVDPGSSTTIMSFELRIPKG